MKERYSTSKLVELLVVSHIASKLEKFGVILLMLTPNLCNSELAREESLFLMFPKFVLACIIQVSTRTGVAPAVTRSKSHGKHMTDA